MKSLSILYVLIALLLLTLFGLVHTECFPYLLGSLALGFCLPKLAKIPLVIVLFLTLLLVFSSLLIKETHHKVEMTNAWLRSLPHTSKTVEEEQ